MRSSQPVLVWLRQHWRALAAIAAIVLAIYLLAISNTLDTALELLPVGWALFLGGSIGYALLRWLGRRENQTDAVAFARAAWREIVLAAAVGYAIGGFFRPDSLTAVLLVGSFLGLLLLGAFLSVAERQPRWAIWRRLRPWQLALLIAALYLTGPLYHRELASEFCDPPRSWEIFDYEEFNDGRSVRPVYECYDPGVGDFVAPRIEGHNHVALTLTRPHIRLFSLDFTYGEYLGFGFCASSCGYREFGRD